MNIQCENCSTRYSIADDVVGGGVYQVRCKRCETIFTIHGENESHAPGAQPTRLRGQRNENSLLFSVNDLMAPTTGGPAPPGDPSEGSGLLDIRRLSGAYSDEPGNGAQSRPEEDWAPITPVGQVLPHLVQPRTHTSSPNRLLWALTSLAGVIAVAAVALGFVLVTEKGEPGTHAATLPGMERTAPAEPEPATAALEPRTAEPAADAEPARERIDEPAAEPADKPADSEPAEAKPAETKPAETKPAESKPSREVARNEPRERRREPARTEPKPKKPEKPAKPEPEPAKRLDEVGCLLAPEPPAYCDKYREASRPSKPRAEEPREARPVRPSRSDIKRGMGKVSGLVSGCATNYPGSGQVTLSIKVDSDGEVSSVSVKDSPNPSLGSCVAKAVRNASFPESQEGITFTYPFMFR